MAGAALLGLSLLLSVGPALGAANHSNGNGGNGNGHGTSGVLKVHDATTGVETSGSGNEPHVCDFWLGFTSDIPEVGTWSVVSVAPTGDGSTVASGTYNTSGDGVDSSGIIDLPAGHYRAEWAATGETVTNKKNFWVDANCSETVTPADESPAVEPASPAEETAVEEPSSPPEEPASPAEEPASPAEEPSSPLEDPILPVEPPSGEESIPTGEEPPADNPGSPSDESPIDESVPTDEEPPIDDPATPSDESPTGDPPVEEPASQVEQPPTQEPGATDPGTPPIQGLLGSTAGSIEPTMSDTATPTVPVPTGLVATFGLLLLILAHGTTRVGKLSVPART